jgi:hypothetical protein
VCSSIPHLLERRVAGALADAVDRALDLAAAGLEAGQRVRHCQTQVVVAVDRYDHVAQVRHQLEEAREHRRELVGHRVGDRVGHVDRRRALVDRDLDDLGEVVHVRA